MLISLMFDFNPAHYHSDLCMSDTDVCQLELKQDNLKFAIEYASHKRRTEPKEALRVLYICTVSTAANIHLLKYCHSLQCSA